MDKVRFGRALGKGTRAAAKSLWEAADAAVASDPSAAPAANRPPQSRPTPHHAPKAPPASATPASARFARAASTSGRSVLAPVTKFSSVLWLELTGSFFALIALFLAQGAWKLKASLHAAAGSPQAHKFYVYLVFLALFAYFAISSFIRAHRRSKR
jgi:hypothetical protein